MNEQGSYGTRNRQDVQQVHIERLVLSGISLPPHARRALVAALQDELSALLTDGGLAPSLVGSASLPRISAPSIEIGPEAPPLEMGRQIARAVYAGIGLAEPQERKGGEA